MELNTKQVTYYQFDFSARSMNLFKSVSFPNNPAFEHKYIQDCSTFVSKFLYLSCSQHKVG